MGGSANGQAGLDLSTLGEALPELTQPSSRAANVSGSSSAPSRPCSTASGSSTADTLPPSPPRTPTALPTSHAARRLSRSRSPQRFFDKHFGRRGSLPLATPPDLSEPALAAGSAPAPVEVTAGSQQDSQRSATDDAAPAVIPLDTLRAMAVSGADFSHFPGVSFHPTGGGVKHTVIHRAVPGGVFGPDLAARLVEHLAGEPLLSPWLSPRTSPALLPLALMPDPKEDVAVDTAGCDELPCSTEETSSQPKSRSSSHSRSASTATWTTPAPRTPGKPPSAAIPRTPPPLTLPLALANSLASPSPRRMPEAWWSGAPSVRAAAWSALMDDDPDVPLSRIVWSSGGSFGIARDGPGSPLVSPQGARSSVDWSAAASGDSVASSAGAGTAGTCANGAGNTAPGPVNTFSFLPPFDADDADMLRALVQAAAQPSVCRSPSWRSRAGRSAAPSPEIVPSEISEINAGSEASTPLPPASRSLPSLSAPATPASPGFQNVTDGCDAAAEQTGLGLDSGPTTGGTTCTSNSSAGAKEAPPAATCATPTPQRESTAPRRNTLSLFGLSARKVFK